MDPTNPTCPAEPNWSAFREMRLTVQEQDGRPVLLAEGAIDDNLIPRLQRALQNQQIEEVWMRSPGGNPRVASEAGILIRHSGVSTRIPTGWTCYGACNFIFLGGITRSVDDGGYYMIQTPPLVALTDADVAAAGSELVNEIAEESALMATDDNNYLIRMGVSRRLLSDIMYRRAEDGSRRRCLSREELEIYNVTPQVFVPSRN
jgi:hypothetical protein